MKPSRLSLAAVIIASAFIVSSSPAQRANLSGLKFCIDPGHGGHNEANDRHVVPDPGIDFWESESNFQKALLLKPLLEARGAWVILTRNTNDYPNDADEPSLTARWTLANTNNVNWFHSIHSNALGGTNTGTNYTLVLLKENISTRKAQFAEAVTMSTYIYNRIRIRNRTSAFGVALDYTFYGGPSGGYNLGVLSGLNMPGELSEGSFHDYFPETRRLMNNLYRKNEAYGIMNGFLEYYGVPFDTLGIIAGVQTNSDNNKPVNGTTVRLLPENRTCGGDAYNNGYFFFDSISTGPHKVRFETSGFSIDTVAVTVTSGGMHFVDHTLGSLAPPIVTLSQPVMNDTSFDVFKTIELTFSKAMDTTSLRSAFGITPSTQGTLTWKSGNMGLVFTPARYLRHNANYQVTVAGTARTATGLFMDGNGDGTGGDQYMLTFKTQFPVPPIVSQTIPSKGDTVFDVTRSIGMRFSKSMDTVSLRTAFSITPTVAGNLTFASNNTVIYFNQKSNLAYSTSYTVRIEGTALSIDSVAIDGNSDSVPGDAFELKFKTVQSPDGVALGPAAMPAEFSLQQNFPNPFNPVTEILFALPHSSQAVLQVFDILGREVKTLVNERLGAGSYRVSFNASSLPSGIYICQLRTAEYTAVRKMALTK